MGKKRRVRWIVGSFVVVLLSFGWAALALTQDDGDVVAESSAILGQQGFEPGGWGDIIFVDNPPDELARFVGPHLSEPQCMALLKDLEDPGWTWTDAFSSSNSETAASGASVSSWWASDVGRRGSYATVISAESSITGSNNDETRIEVRVYNRTLLDWLGL